MAKYYVTSGEVRTVVQAEDARTAALWTMHLAMEKGVDLDQLDLSLDQREDLARFDLMVRFDRWMAVSEIGFDREEAHPVDRHRPLLSRDRLDSQRLRRQS